MRYRWATPHEWLFETYSGVIDGQLQSLLSKLDGDDIQEVYQSDMAEDEYFRDLDEPTDEEKEAFVIEAIKENAVSSCYYGDPVVCDGELWECLTCHNEYCEEHNHSTDLGDNVECVACERIRLENTGDDIQ